MDSIVQKVRRRLRRTDSQHGAAVSYDAHGQSGSTATSGNEAPKQDGKPAGQVSEPVPETPLIMRAEENAPVQAMVENLSLAGEEESGRRVEVEVEVEKQEASSVASPNVVEEAPTETPSNADPDVTATRSSRNDELEALWDDAYNQLRASNPSLVAWYEKILNSRLSEDVVPSSPRDFHAWTSEVIESSIFSIIPSARHSQMSLVLKTWFGKSTSSLEQGDHVFSPKTSLRQIIERTPQAVLGWVAACIALETQLNQSSDDDRSSTIDLVTKMEWYMQLSRLVTANDQNDHAYLDQEQLTLLRVHLVGLYESVLTFFVTVVCRKHGTQLIHLVRDLPDLPASDPSTIYDAEQSLAASLGQDFKHRLNQLLDSPKDRQPSVYSANKSSHSHQESQVFADLDAIDPRPDFVNRSTEVNQEAYQWLASTVQYQEFLDWNNKEATTFWITGPPGSGKSTLLTTVVQNLLAQAQDTPDLPRLLYCFISASGPVLRSAASVVKSLICLILLEQPTLDVHLANLRLSTGRKHFNHPSDFVPLSGLFYDILQDSNLPQTYVVVDAVDECVGSSDLMQLIETSGQVTPRIKWLASTRANNVTPQGSFHLNLGTQAKFMYCAVEKYVAHRVFSLSRQRFYDTALRDQVQQLIVDRSGGNYPWIHAICQMLRTTEPRHALDVLSEAPTLLGDLFAYLDTRIEQLPYHDPQSCRMILSIAAAAYRSLHVDELAALAQLPQWVHPTDLLTSCYGFLEMRDKFVHFPHQMSMDHVIKKANSKYEDSESLHSFLVQRCLDAISNFFDNNSENQHSDAPTAPTVEESSTPVSYPLSHWMKHACEISEISKHPEAKASISLFLQNHVLEWLKAIKDMGQLDLAMSQCRTLLLLWKRNSRSESNLISLIRDAGQLLSVYALGTPRSVSTADAFLFCPESTGAKQNSLAKHFPWVTVRPMIPEHYTFLELQGHSDVIRDIEFSSDGKLLVSASDDRTVRIWDVETGTTQRVIQDHDDWVTRVSISQDFVASGSDDRVLHIWSLPLGQPILDFQHTRKIVAVKFSLDGKRLFVADSSNRPLSTWDMTTYVRQERIFYTTKRVRGAEYSHGGALVACMYEDEVEVLDTDSYQIRHSLTFPSSKCLAFSKDARRLALAKGSIEIWDIHELGKQHPVVKLDPLSPTHVTSLAFSSDGATIASTDATGVIKLWDIKSSQTKAVFQDEGAPLRVAFSPAGHYLATSSKTATISFWHNEERAITPPSAVVPTDDPIYALAISSDESCIAVAQRARIRFWNAKTGQLMEGKKEMPHDQSVLHLIFSPKSSLLASSSIDKSVKIWRVDDGENIHTLNWHTDWVRQAAFSPCERFVASASDDNMVRVWDLENTSISKELSGHAGYVTCVCFSPDGQTLVSGGDDCTVRVWDLKSHSPRFPALEGHRGQVVDLTFISGSKFVLSSSDDNSIMIWDITKGKRVSGPIETKHIYRGLYYDPKSSGHIMTHWGARAIPIIDGVTASNRDQRSSWAPYGVLLEGEKDDKDIWITWNDRKVIYIPRDYDVIETLVYGRNVILGCRKGQVLIFGFSPNVEPLENTVIRRLTGIEA